MQPANQIRLWHAKTRFSVSGYIVHSTHTTAFDFDYTTKYKSLDFR